MSISTRLLLRLAHQYAELAKAGSPEDLCLHQDEFYLTFERSNHGMMDGFHQWLHNDDYNFSKLAQKVSDLFFLTLDDIYKNGIQINSNDLNKIFALSDWLDKQVEQHKTLGKLPITPETEHLKVVSKIKELWCTLNLISRHDDKPFTVELCFEDVINHAELWQKSVSILLRLQKLGLHDLAQGLEITISPTVRSQDVNPMILLRKNIANAYMILEHRMKNSLASSISNPLLDAEQERLLCMKNQIQRFQAEVFLLIADLSLLIAESDATPILLLEKIKKIVSLAEKFENLHRQYALGMARESAGK